MFRRIGIVFLMALLMAACAPQGVDEACCVVAEADSLWQAGQTYDDSLRLAQAYETLSSFCSPLLSTLHPKHSTDYAHACYHYGRLLRRADDPVAAMQVFISGTHSGTDDHNILGRLYSNMGSICHMAKDFQQSYDMYELSANYFLQNGDTLLYYYGQINMAIEAAEQKDSIRTMKLINSIESIQRPELYKSIMETKALLYQSIQKYDSVISIVSQLQAIGYKEVYGCIMKARAFSYLQQKDSSLQYARWLLPQTNEYGDLVDLYYILSKDNVALSKDSLDILSSIRIDIQKEWTTSKQKYAQAAQVLKNEIDNKANIFKRIRLLIVILGVVLIGIGVAVILIRRKHKIIESKQIKQEQQLKLLEVQQTEYQLRVQTDIAIACQSLCSRKNIKNDLQLENMDKMCSIANTYFNGIADKLLAYPDVTHLDVRLSLLFLLELPYNEIAELLNISPNSIGKLKSNTARKLGTTMKDFHKKLLEIACSPSPQR